jgi:hypothetical protein
LFFTHKRHDRILIDDITLNETILLKTRHGLEARQITGVCQRIKHHNPILTVLISPVVHEIGANEPGAACNE